MLKLKFEILLLLIALLLAALFTYRYLTKPLPEKSERANGPSQVVQLPQAPRPSGSPLKNAAPDAPKVAAAPTVSPQTENSPEFKKYRELLQNPTAGMDRLHLIEKLEKQESRETLAMLAYNEVLNSGPKQEFSAVENHERRSIVSVAFSMYLDHCLDFASCYPYAVIGVARYQDPELMNDLYQQIIEKYPEAWQQEQVLAEMKKYGLGLKKGAPK